MLFSVSKCCAASHADLAPEHRAALAARFQLPDPRTELGPRLAGVAHAMCDVSDGLVADLGHICEQSGVSAAVRLPELPLSAAARPIVADMPDILPQLATAGDDYELLFTAPASADTPITALSQSLGLPIAAIGMIEAGDGVRLLDAEGRPLPIERPGYRHF